MPYYPQKITIQYRHPDLYQTLTILVKISDCDGDDPTCHEYYDDPEGYNASDNTQFIVPESRTLDRHNRIEVDKSDLKLIIYNIEGKRMSLQEFKSLDDSIYPVLAILTYWDAEGDLIDVQRVLKY
jgi:hypothetical protein